jgi:hypothetical protein
MKSCCGLLCPTRMLHNTFGWCDLPERRPDYFDTFLDKLISWEAVAGRLAQAKAFVNLGQQIVPEK